MQISRLGFIRQAIARHLVSALREAGAKVAGVAVIVDRGARAKVAERGLEFRAAYGIGDLGLG